MISRRLFLKGATSLISPPCFAASNFDDKGFRLILPFQFGGGATINFVESLKSKIKGSFYEFKPGASGLIAMQYLSQLNLSQPAVLLATPSITTLSYLTKKVKGNFFLDYQPVVKVSNNPFVLMCNSRMGSNFKEFLSYCRKYPDQINFGSPGIGSLFHFSYILMHQLFNVKAEHIPYSKGTFQAAQAQEIDFYFCGLSDARQLEASGKGVILGVTSGSRLLSMNSVPSTTEFHPRFKIENMTGLITNRNMSATDILDLSRIVNDSITNELIDLIDSDGGTITKSYEPSYYIESIKSEYRTMATLVQYGYNNNLL